MLKPVSGLKLVKFLKKMGFSVYSRKSAPVKMISLTRKTKTIIPMHKEISPGTLNRILRQAKLSDKEIRELTKK